MDIYQHKGFENRHDYLEQLALEHGVPEDAVFAVADLLGAEEDFDGLVSMVQDYDYMQ